MTRRSHAPSRTTSTVPAARPAPLSLHIERLVLHGLPLGRDGSARLQAVLGAELGRLLSHAVLRSDLQRGAALAALPLRGVTLDAGASAERLAEQLARALSGGLVARRHAGPDAGGEDHE